MESVAPVVIEPFSAKEGVMPATNAAAQLDVAQAAELAQLLDAEACWQNMRKAAGGDAETADLRKNLEARQKAYEAFRVKLVAYNGRYRPAHVPELMLNTATRLGGWCGKVRGLYQRLGHDARAQRPLHLLEKACRAADHIARRLGRDRVGRMAPPSDIPSAIRALDEMAAWCAALEANPVAHPHAMAVRPANDGSSSPASHEV
jgi:hypothetical protein